MLAQKKKPPPQPKQPAEPARGAALPPGASAAIPLFLTAAGLMRRPAAAPPPAGPGEGSGAPRFPFLQRFAAPGALPLGPPDDAYEREAESTAEQVMRTPARGAAPPCGCGGTCPECRARAAGVRLQLSRAPQAGGAGPSPASVQLALASAGHPLDAETRAFMEPRFGRDFGDVRVHTGAQADESARAVDARAYTVGRDLAFRAGEYAPHTPAGRRLLAHDLAHVVQQGHGSPQVQRQLITPLAPGGGLGGVMARDRAQAQPPAQAQQPAEPEALDLGRIPRVAGPYVQRIVVSCADMVIALVAADGVHVYTATACDLPLGSYTGTPVVTGNNFYVDLGIGRTQDSRRARFGYRVRRGQPNPANMLSGQQSVQVDVVPRVRVPAPSPRNPCLLLIDPQEVIPAGAIERELFPAQAFNETLWSHTILLGEFGWVEASVTASGSATGQLTAGYGPGRLTDICLVRPLGQGRLSGSAHFVLPADVNAVVVLDGTVRIDGRFLSLLSLAAVNGRAVATGTAAAEANLDAGVEVTYDPNAPRKWSFALANRLSLAGSLGFTLDTSVGVSVLGQEIWTQMWRLVNAQVGASWQGGLNLGTDLGLELDPGALSVTGGGGPAGTGAPGAPSVPGAGPAGTGGGQSGGGGAGSTFGMAAVPPSSGGAAPPGGPPAPSAGTPPAGGGAGTSAVGTVVSAVVNAVLAQANSTVSTQPIPVRAPHAIQQMGRDTAAVPMDPKLTEEALKWRLNNTDLGATSFRRNVAVFKVDVGGTISYITEANDEGELHSESNVLARLQTADPKLTRTRILAVYSERQPCPNCASDLNFVRRTLQQNFPIYFSVSQRVAPQSRASTLRRAYTP